MKYYTIAEISKKTNLSPYTVRYYDNEGLIPNLERDKHGNRIFSEKNLEVISVICCLKETGMPIKEIKKFMKWLAEGDKTLHDRLDMLEKHKNYVTELEEKLRKNIKIIDEKLEYFKKVCSAYDKGKPVPKCCISNFSKSESEKEF